MPLTPTQKQTAASHYMASTQERGLEHPKIIQELLNFILDNFSGPQANALKVILNQRKAYYEGVVAEFDTRKVEELNRIQTELASINATITALS